MRALLLSTTLLLSACGMGVVGTGGTKSGGFKTIYKCVSPDKDFATHYTAAIAANGDAWVDMTWSYNGSAASFYAGADTTLEAKALSVETAVVRLTLADNVLTIMCLIPGCRNNPGQPVRSDTWTAPCIKSEYE